MPIRPKMVWDFMINNPLALLVSEELKIPIHSDFEWERKKRSAANELLPNLIYVL